MMPQCQWYNHELNQHHNMWVHDDVAMGVAMG